MESNKMRSNEDATATYHVMYEILQDGLFMYANTTSISL